MEGVQVIGNSQCSVSFREQYSLQVSLEHGQRQRRNLADCSTLVPQPRERHGRRQWTAVMEERRERVLMPSAGAAAYRGRQHAGSRWRGTVAQRHGDSGKREQRACTQSAAPPSANAALAEVTSRNRTSATRTRDEQRHSTRTAVC